jgi:hypothetical protein
MTPDGNKASELKTATTDGTPSPGILALKRGQRRKGIRPTMLAKQIYELPYVRKRVQFNIER